MLGDWGAHIIDFAHDYLELGLPTSIKTLGMDDHNEVIFPLNSRLAMHFPARGEGLPACDLTWRDGADCQPEVGEQFWDADAKGEKRAPKLGGAGTLLHRADGEFLVQRGSHASVSRIYPREVMIENAEHIKIPGPELNHAQSFTQACLGTGTTTSNFQVAAPLTKVLLLGVICQYLNEDLEFDPESEQFLGNDSANAMLKGPAPRKGWEEYYEAI